MLSPGMIVAFSQKKTQTKRPQKFTLRKNSPANLTVLTWMLFKKKKKVLQKEKQHLLGVYSCTPFISKLISRCQIFPLAEGTFLQQSNPILPCVQGEQRTGLFIQGLAIKNVKEICKKLQVWQDPGVSHQLVSLKILSFN